MAEILLIPYGNAKEYPNGDSWTYTCQHGINECLYNQIETCSNNYISDPLVAFNFIECIESIETQDTYHKVGPQDLITMCGSVVLAAELSGVYSCWNAPEAIGLYHANAQLTAALVPSHEYVQWVVGQGVHTDDI